MKLMSIAAFLNVWVTLAGLPALAGEAEDKALALIKKREGSFGRDEKAPGKPVVWVDLDGKTVSNADLKELAALKQLRELYVGYTQVSDAGLKELTGLKHLRKLVLDDNTRVTDAGLKELARLEQLQFLALAGTKVTDSGLKKLAGLKQLRSLYLGTTAVGDAGLKELAALKQLETLELGYTSVTDAGLAALAGLQHLKALDLQNTKVTDAGLKELARLKQLQSLELGSTQVKDAGLKHLAGLQKLQKLDLGATEVTDLGLKELAKLKQLQSLDISSTRVTNAGLKELAGLKQLRRLALDATQVTDAGLKELTALMQLQQLYLGYTKVSDAGLKELAHVKLRTLHLHSTRVTDAGLKELAAFKELRELLLEGTKTTPASLAELQRALPKCKIAGARQAQAPRGQAQVKERLVLKGHNDSITDVAFSPDGKILASAGGDKTVRLWDPATGKLVGVLEEPAARFNHIWFFPDSKTLVTFGNATKFWDVATRKVKSTFEAGRLLALSPDARTAAGILDKSVVLWDVKSGKEIRRLDGEIKGPMAFSPDGNFLATVNKDYGVTLIDLANGKPKAVMNGVVDRGVFSPDGKTLATGTRLPDEEAVKLWDVAGGKLKKQFHSGTRYVEKIAFAPDGKSLAHGCYERSFRIWDLETGKEGLDLGDADFVWAVAFSPDGKTLAAGTVEGEVKLWDVAALIPSRNVSAK